MSVVDGVLVLVPPPPGYVVNFDNPQRQADVPTYWLAGIGLIFAMLFTAQRVYVKSVVVKRFQLDDLLLFLAWVTSIATQFLVLYMFASGIGGVHSWEIPLVKFNKYLLVVYIAAWIYVLSGSFAKIALLVFYLRLSPQQWFRYSVFATLALIFGYTTGIFFSLIFACDPIERSFDITITTGSCINSAALYIATAAANITSDVILFILPIPMVVKLQVPLKQKIGLMFIFGIGSITIVTSILRAAVLPSLLTSTDPTWDVSYASLLIVVEANLIIVCGMLPTLRKFILSVAPRLIDGSTYGRSKGGMTPKTLGRSGLVTYGSTPSKGLSRQRDGYAKFGYGSDDYAMEPISVPVTRGAAMDGLKKSEVTATVVAGNRLSDWDDDGRPLDTPASMESQLPIMGGRSQGIRTTTKIEVSYEGEAPGRAF
ncbi:hypothetical protein INS49_004459 [Diaporthe citri]|uniref:uncharacterized protein n=1 Tax=Diaporthe citri TaxID=83186 RepID=UPI001C8250F2|nr:uncharacterized protein INS49_004459 [Diaporthe citri]KAG6354442.1 hypothetical protein INS49_004459 [Diaporthe citri]